jgi:2-polyprenyl-3-methyl-5-hydroxy-6-metoxy-1,4-benzoquinol methylase
LEVINYSDCPGCKAAGIYPVITTKDYTVTGQQFSIWQCKQCSLRFTQDVPAQSSIGHYYQSDNYISHTDTTKGVVNSLYHLIRKRTLVQKKKMIERLTRLLRGRLLDIGAGTGAFSVYMQQAGWEVTGLEPDEHARKRAADLYGMNLLTAGELFNIPARSYDAVTMWHVLEHVHDLHGYLHQLSVIVSKKGRAFIAVPNYTSFDASVYKEYWAAYDVPRHLYHFSPRSMKLLLGSHNMKVTAIAPMWYDSFYVAMLSEQYRNSSPGYVKAAYNGLVSNWQAVKNREKCSSLIYVVEV